jgi:rRNA maturation RNase YbeY
MSPKFLEIKNTVLGKKYDLSVAFLSTVQMKKAMVYKKPSPKKDSVASNVLAFPLSKTSGEIVICRATAKKQAPKFGMSERAFIHYLFIHGLLHIKGYRHGATMDREEHRLLERFDFRTNGKNRHRN